MSDHPECDDPTCGCKDPAFTEPLEALRFLSGRFKHAGVGEAVARSYARDIDRILAQYKDDDLTLEEAYKAIGVAQMRDNASLQADLTRLRAEHDALVERLRGLPRQYSRASDDYWICAADLERLLPVTNPDDPIHDKRRQDAEELAADRREALQELGDAVNGCDED